MSTQRIVTGPEDLEGGWFVVDGEVVHLEDVEWAKPSGGGTAAPEETRTELVAGTHRFTTGDTVELAGGTALDDGFRDAVRRYWRTPISIVATPTVFALLHLVPVPSFEGHPWRERIVLVLATLLVVLAVQRLWTALTRSHDSRTTRTMAGWRLRADYDRQRGAEGPSDAPGVVRP